MAAASLKVTYCKGDLLEDHKEVFQRRHASISLSTEMGAPCCQNESLHHVLSSPMTGRMAGRKLDRFVAKENR